MTENVTPASAKEAGEVISSVCGTASVEVIGGGSKRALGRPVRGDVRLSTSRLVGIRNYDPRELVATVGAGTSLREIEEVFTCEGQYLAFEPRDLGALFGQDPDQGTIGGIIATNQSGPRRLRVGAARDHILGFEGVNGRGEIFRSGGRVVKNVTGFDLSKLMAGSYGTLAMLSNISLRVLPVPECTLTIAVAVPKIGAAEGIFRLALHGAFETSGAAYLPQSLSVRSSVSQLSTMASDVVLLRLEGHETSVVARAETLSQQLVADGELIRLDRDDSLSLWREIRDLVTFLPTNERQIWRIGVPPAVGPRIAAELCAVAAGETMLDWGGGLIWLSIPTQRDAAAGAVRKALSSHGGYAHLIVASEAIRGEVPVFQPLPTPIAELTRRLKHSFDPLGVLNPGRMYSDV